MMDIETYQLLMIATQAVKNLAEAVRLYYSLKSKPASELNAHERIHIENMEVYAQWTNLNL